MTIKTILNIDRKFGKQVKGQDYSLLLKQAIQSYDEAGLNEYLFSSPEYEFIDPQALHDYGELVNGSYEYELSSKNTMKNSLIYLENRNSFHLNGQGALFTYSGLIQPFHFVNCHNIHICNVKIDWERPLFSQGRVIRSEDDYFIIEIFPEFPVTGTEPISAILDYDPGSINPLAGKIDLFWVVKSTESVGPQLVKVNLKIPLPIAAGTHLILRHINNYRPAFLFYKCSNVTFENVEIYSAPGMGIIAHKSEGFSFQNLSVRTKPDSNRVLSTNTDATHFISCKGNIAFKDCFFQGMGDDAVNVHGSYIRAVKKLDVSTIVGTYEMSIQSEELDTPESGDYIEYVKSDTLKKYAVGIIKDITVLKDNKTVRVIFEEPLPSEFKEGDLLANSSCIAQLRFENCTIKNNRARGLLIQTRNVVIDNNLFDHCTGTGIHINCASNWMESISTDQITVTNNRFIKCGNAAGTYNRASAVAVTTESASFAAGVHSNILIANNEIIGNGQVGIALSVSTEVTIRDNSFKNCESASVVKYSRNVTFRGNIVSPDMVDVRIEE